MGADRQNNPLWDKELDTEAKLDWLLAQLTTDEKLHMLASGSKGVERLDIPDMRLGGISRWAPTVDLLRDPRWGRIYAYLWI